jgi:hypothetical protein
MHAAFSDPLYVLIWVLMIPDSSTRALWCNDFLVQRLLPEKTDKPFASHTVSETIKTPAS